MAEQIELRVDGIKGLVYCTVAFKIQDVFEHEDTMLLLRQAAIEKSG